MSDEQERIMVVKRSTLDRAGLFYGLRKSNVAPYLRCILKESYFIPRYLAEESPIWKQIVVYCVIQHADQVLVFQRRGHGEAANGLDDKFSIGVGGHVALQDVSAAKQQDVDVFLAAARRELSEELDYGDAASALDFQMLGLLNDDTDAVGQLHFGIVFQVNLANQINVRAHSELRENSGFFSNLANLTSVQHKMENWSSLILEGQVIAV